MSKEQYMEIGQRLLSYDIPSAFDVWGYDVNGNQWNYSFCVMDDFGNAVPADPFAHHMEGYASFLGPDYDPNTPVGEPYKYVLYHPTVH